MTDYEVKKTCMFGFYGVRFKTVTVSKLNIDFIMNSIYLFIYILLLANEN